MGGQTTSDKSHPGTADGKSRSRGATRRYGLDIATCWTRAKARMREASGLNVDAEARRIGAPVERARRLAEVAAPADMRLSLALGLGAEARDLELDKSGARLLADLAHKRLSIVGLRAGETIEHDASERFQDFLTRFTDPAARARRAQESDDADA